MTETRQFIKQWVCKTCDNILSNAHDLEFRDEICPECKDQKRLEQEANARQEDIKQKTEQLLQTHKIKTTCNHKIEWVVENHFMCNKCRSTFNWEGFAPPDSE